MRVAYFNELDSYAESLGLNIARLSKAFVSIRVLATITTIVVWLWWLLSAERYQAVTGELQSVPNNLISAIVDANRTRKVLLPMPFCHANRKWWVFIV